MLFLSLLISIALQADVVSQYFLVQELPNDVVAQATTSASLGIVAGVEEVNYSPKRIYDTKSIGVVLSAPTSLVVDIASGDVLWEQDADVVVPIASITKLVAVATLLDQGLDLDSIIKMSSADLRPEGGNRHIYLGESVIALDLLHAVLISSDNEALIALVHSTGMTEEEFVVAMNSWADKNSLDTINIIEPTGLNSGDVASARDVARLAQIVFTNDVVTNIAKKPKYNFQTVNTRRIVKLYSTDRLLDSSFGVEVGKTGFIDEAGYCLVTKTNITNNKDIITVVLGADSINNRFQDTKALIYWVGENYRW